MIGRLNHRGPDGCGYFRDHHAALGHARLSIIDEAGGAQPLTNEDGRIWLIFNGEIFNYVELREQLRDRGHRFRTASDSEVIVHAWEEWGEACFSRFNGQWALALWDRLERRLVLSRDRLGVRPLYYTVANGRLLFASEVKSIFADPSVQRAFDPIGLGETFTYWSSVAPRTAYAGIEQLEPGYFATYDGAGFRKAPYWTPSFPSRGEESKQDSAASADELRDQLIEAVRLRFLRSDVPVAAYLSGGIDSAVTAALMNTYTDVPLRTFSLRFADAEYDEGEYQHQMVAKLGADHKEVEISGGDIAGVFPEVVWYAEAPMLRSAPAPMFLLSRLVREHGFKVVVTGEGADEVLGGYDLFREARVRMFWARGPESAKRARAAELLYPWMTRSPGRAPAFARSFFARNLDPSDPAMSHRPRWDSTSVVKEMLAPEWRRAASTVSGDELLDLMPRESKDWDPLSRAQWLEMSTLLPGYILASQGDRMLMGNSVEGRFPFLDRNVVEFAQRLPARHKLFGLREKYLLMRAFEGIVPPAILDRPKQPYRAPDVAAFFSGSAPTWVSEVTAREAVLETGVFEPARVAGLVEKCVRTGGRNMGNTDSMRMMAVLSTQLAHRQLIAQRGPRFAERRELDIQVAIDLVENEDGSI
jgi:asparagine synthase (glutamine-hydrolysing)